MSDFLYGFVDINNRVLEFFVVDENDIQTLDSLKEFCNAVSYYKMVDKNKELVGLKENQYWNGERFIWDSPYASWVFDKEINNWLPPVMLPAFDPENPKHYRWNEDIINWEEIPLSE